jgi:hypothetical protein
VLTAVDFLGRKLIVRATADAEVLFAVGAAECARLDVIELQKRSRLAAALVGRDIRAS